MPNQGLFSIVDILLYFHIFTYFTHEQIVQVKTFIRKCQLLFLILIFVLFLDEKWN